jgi:Ser/Thr protein kinase RdoA (MazF antagonist)
VDYAPSTSVWGLVPRDPAEVICHNDFAPYNCVFRDHKLVGVIDFDACAPGPRVWDIAYALYRFVPLMPPVTEEGFGETSPFPWDAMVSRTARFLDAYAASDVTLLFSTLACLRLVAERLLALASWTERHSVNIEDPSLLAHAKMYRMHANWLNKSAAKLPPAC